MAIIEIVTSSRFHKAFARADCRRHFAPESLTALYHYLDDLSEEIERDIVLDPVAICCDWFEYTTEEAIKEFSSDDGDFPNPADHEDIRAAIYDWLQNRTSVIKTSNRFVVQNF